MQRLSNTALSLALILFVSAISLALIAAAWLIAIHILNGQVNSSLPKWLLVGLLVTGLNQANAQTSTTDMYVVTAVYMKQPDISKAAIIPLDTLLPSVQRHVRRQERRISSKPAWPSDNCPPVTTPAEPDMSSDFYIMAVASNPSAYKTGYWFRSRP